MRVLVWGGSGLLGRAFLRTASRVDRSIVIVPVSRTRTQVKFDATRREEAERALQFIRPQAVINLVGNRDPSSWKDSQTLQMDNVQTATNIARNCQRYSVPLVHVSTDYVFPGDQPPYGPESGHNPLNAYGLSKSTAESAVLTECPTAGIVRLPVLYGQVEYLNECNLSALLPLLMTEQFAKVDHWARRRPTHVDDVAVHILEELIAGRTESRTWHATSAQAFSKFEMAHLLANVLELPVGHLTKDLTPANDRPYDTDLRKGDHVVLKPLQNHAERVAHNYYSLFKETKA